MKRGDVKSTARANRFMKADADSRLVSIQVIDEIHTDGRGFRVTTNSAFKGGV